MLILRTLDNVQTTLSFSMSSFTILTNVEITLSIWPDAKSWKIKLDLSATKYFWASNKKHLKLNTLNSVFQLLFQNLVQFILHFNRNMKKNICKAAKVLETWESWGGGGGGGGEGRNFSKTAASLVSKGQLH